MIIILMKWKFKKQKQDNKLGLEKYIFILQIQIKSLMDISLYN